MHVKDNISLLNVFVIWLMYFFYIYFNYQIHPLPHHTCVYMYVHVRVHASMHMCICVHVCERKYVVWVCVCVKESVCMYVCKGKKERKKKREWVGQRNAVTVLFLLCFAQLKQDLPLTLELTSS